MTNLFGFQPKTINADETVMIKDASSFAASNAGDKIR